MYNRYSLISCTKHKWQHEAANKMRRNSQFGRGTLPEAWQETNSGRKEWWYESRDKDEKSYICAEEQGTENSE